jgi:hypothetical protein
VSSGELSARARYESFDALWEPFEGGVAPSGAYAAALGPERRAALRDELFRSLGSPREPFELSARAWYVTGVAP